MVFSNAENKRGGANETTRSPLLGARIWPDGRATSSSARTLFCESYGPGIAPERRAFSGLRTRAGGACKNILRPKSRTRRWSKNAKCPLFLKIAPAACRTGHAVPAIFQTREFAAARPCSM